MGFRGEVVLYCQFGGKFTFSELKGVKIYRGGRAKTLKITQGTTFTEFKLLLAKTFSLDHQKTLSFEYVFVRTGFKYHTIENDKDLEKMIQSCEYAALLFVDGTPVNRNTGHDDEASISKSTRKVNKVYYDPWTGKRQVTAYCQFGGKFVLEEVLGVKYYCGSDIKVKGLGIFEGTTLTDFKLLVAKTFSLNHETVALHYQLPLRGYHYAAIEDDKDVEKIIQTCEVAVRVCVFGTPVDMKTSAAAKHKASAQESELDMKKDVSIHRKPGSTANNKASSQASSVVRVTRSAAAKHEASSQEIELEMKKDVGIKRKRSATANDKAVSQAKMFSGTLPSKSDSIKEEMQEDSDGMMVRDHDVPSNTNNQDEEPSSVHSRKRIPQMDSLIEVLTTKMSREEAFEKKADMVICELSKMKSLSQRERFKAMDIITSNPRYVKIFWGLGEEEREEWVRFKLQN